MFERNFHHNFILNDFLNEYWQKKTVVIKQAFKNFQDPISAEELAGLAMESEPDSRTVSNQGGDWILTQGPFENFEHLPEKNWSLLVQGVDHWHENCELLTQAFHFLPRWRFDDLMVTYATEGGGVGPHIDNYDVFIIQGEGRRHWRVGDKGSSKLKTVISGVQHCEPFEAIIDEVLEKGDMLYIPAGFPHEGVTVTDALSYSMGYRAPDQGQLLSSLADHLAEHHHLQTQFYTDPNMLNRTNACGALQKKELASLKALVLKLFDDEQMVESWLGSSLSRSRHDLDSAVCQVSLEEIDDAFAQGQQCHRLYGLKLLYIEQSPQKLFVEGEFFEVEKELSILLCDQSVINSKMYSRLSLHSKNVLLDFIQRGFWYFS